MRRHLLEVANKNACYNCSKYKTHLEIANEKAFAGVVGPGGGTRAGAVDVGMVVVGGRLRKMQNSSIKLYKGL